TSAGSGNWQRSSAWPQQPLKQAENDLLDFPRVLVSAVEGRLPLPVGAARSLAVHLSSARQAPQPRRFDVQHAPATRASGSAHPRTGTRSAASSSMRR
ncbi:MAG TPA: hypothetical protein DCQ64_32530, partial [Candidatus Rokubacteria bacterium]|nr:hypothetical protein [Candidatus Rokubacteria bacterium]